MTGRARIDDDPDGREHTGAQPAAHHVQQVLDRLLHERVAVARSNGTMHDLFPVAIPAAEGEALRDWVRRENATRTIEIGLGYGIAALFICAGLLDNGTAGVRHVGIDPYQTTRFADCAIQFLDEAGVAGLVECHREGSEIVLPRLLSRGCRFDLAFVDGNHRFDGVFMDLVLLGRLVDAGRVNRR